MAKHITGNTTHPVGIIPFGSTDEAVVYQDAFTDPSEPGNGVMLGSGATFDVNGMNTNGTAAWQLDLSGLDFTSLTYSGQISFDIVSTAIGTIAAYASYNHTGSEGIAPTTANDVLISWSDKSDASGEKGMILGAADNTLYFNMMSSGGSTDAVRCTNHGRVGEYITVTVAWDGTNGYLYLDGSYLYRQLNAEVFADDLFKYITIGSQQNSAGASVITSADRYIKNVIVSNRPPMFASHPMLSKPAFMGDSFASAASITSLSSGIRFNYQPLRVLQGYLAGKGLWLGMPTRDKPRIAGVGAVSTLYAPSAIGGVVDGDGTAAVEMSTKVSDMLALKPSIGVLYIGINDVIKPAGYNIGAFETKYKSLLDSLLVAGSSIQKMFIHTTISLIGSSAEYTATAISRTAEVNAVINSLPAWWDAANPTDTGRVVVVDLFAAFGGEPANDNTVYGRWSTSNSSYNAEIHPSSYGGYIMGNELGKAIYKNL